MDAVEFMNIGLDIQERLLYDYKQCAFVKSPQEALEKSKDKGLVKVNVMGLFKDDGSKLRQRHMQRGYYTNAKNSLEKHAPSQDVKKFKDRLHVHKKHGPSLYSSYGEYHLVPKHILPMYKPGDRIKGTVVLKLKKFLKAESICVHLIGRATVNVRTGTSDDCYVEPWDRTITKHEKFIEKTLLLWKSSKSSKNFQNPNTLVEDKDLGRGTHEFEFYFKLPDNLVSSIIPLSSKKDNYMHITYFLKAVIDQGKLFGRGNLVAFQGLWINRPTDVAGVEGGLDPVDVEQKKTPGVCSTGDITCKVYLPRTAFCAAACSRREMIPVTLIIENHSVSVIQKVSARIRLEGKGQIKTRYITQSFLQDAIPVKAGPVLPGECPVYRWNLKFDFSKAYLDPCNLPPSEAADMTDSIDFKYVVFVRLKTNAVCGDMTMSIPVTVCSFNSASTTKSEA